jgi:zinc transport system substrate-binding protein
MTTPLIRRLTAGGLSVIAGGALVACGSADASTADVTAVAAFYPLQFVTEQVGAGHVDVTNLTAAGAEPHDLEMAPQQMADITDADVVVYLSGFQPAVDEAVQQQAADRSLDVGNATELIDSGSEHHEHQHGDAPEEESEHGGIDPHVWLDPTRLADIATGVADRLSDIDPDHARDYSANASNLSNELSDLDGQYADGLSQCRSDAIVTSHAAFGYLTERYGLQQIAVTGLVPEAEPTAEDIHRIVDYVKDHDVTTVFYETLVDPGVAETIKSETGATTAVLDPIEGLAKNSDDDYLSVMRSNLAALQTALGCES